MEVLGNTVDGFDAWTVLIVEDEWLVRMELAAAFEDEGCTVLESTSAEDALAGLRLGARIDLLVTDIRLGGMLNGWDLAAAVRGLDAGVAVIYVSANPFSPERDVGDSVFIDKPALVAEVVSAARKLLGRA
jgi:CheY-like chemotaxis protein